MEPSPLHSAPAIQDDDWDTDGFVIPSLSIEVPNQSKPDVPEIADVKPSAKVEENIYLGPHGAPPSQAKQQDLSQSRKQRFKNKLREADKKFAATAGRENRVENIRELVGSKSGAFTNMSKSSPRDWLDPHCHESQFQKHTR